MEQNQSLSFTKSILQILLIPTLGLGFFIAAPSWQEHKIRGAFAEEIRKNEDHNETEKAKTLEVLPRINFSLVCNSTDEKLSALRSGLEKEGFCRSFQLFQVGNKVSIGLLLGLIGLLTTILIQSKKARRSREALIQAYKTCWNLSITGALVKLFVQTPLLAYAFFQFTVLLADRYYPKVLLALVAGAGIAMWQSLKSLLKSVPLEFGEPIACEIERSENPELWRKVDSIASKLGTNSPAHIIAGFTTNFYVTEMSVTHNEGKTSGKTLYLSIPLMKLLSTDDIEAIVGHELGHFLGEDTKLSRDFYPFKFKVAVIQQMLGGSGWSGRSGLYLLDYFISCFASIEQEFSRERELAADQQGALATSAAKMAKALLRVHAYSEAHQRATNAAGEINPHLDSRMVSKDTLQDLLSSQGYWDELLTKKLPHPLDSHPPLALRLEALASCQSRSEALDTIQTRLQISAFETWFTGLEQDVQLIEKKYLAEMNAVRTQLNAKTADYESASGQEFLDRHFPPKEFTISSWRFLPLIFMMVPISIFFIWLGIKLDDVAMQALVFPIGITLGAYHLALLRNHHKGKFTLTASGLRYTGWRREVNFTELTSIEVREDKSTKWITLRFPKKHRPLSRFYLLPILRKSERVPVSYFVGGADPAIASIFLYYRRELPHGADVAPYAGDRNYDANLPQWTSEPQESMTVRLPSSKSPPSVSMPG